MGRIELRSVTKVYPPAVKAVQDVSLELEAGGLLTLVGPSGSGKSTLLRLIAGLETPDAGQVILSGRDAAQVPAHRRGVALLFQPPALYPHLGVRQNLAPFGTLAAPPPEADGHKAELAGTDEGLLPVVRLLGIEGLLSRRVFQLSAGEQQRVALGRALLKQPRFLLLDEPLAQVDSANRTRIRLDLAQSLSNGRMTVVWVTHDPAEAQALGGRVGVMAQGRLVQVGSPQELHENPAAVEVARLIGSPTMNLFECSLSEAHDQIQIPLAQVSVPIPVEYRRVWSVLPPRRVMLGWRAEDVKLSPGTGWRLQSLEYHGIEWHAWLARHQLRLVARLPLETGWKAGDSVNLELNWARAHAFDPVTGNRLPLRKAEGSG